MSRWSVDNWIHEEHDSNVVSLVAQNSAVEAVARHIPMGTNAKTVPRSGDVDVDIIPKGTAYGEDTSGVDEITLTAKKFGKAIRIAEEDIDDSFANVLEDRKGAWARSYAITLDNACLGTTDAVDTDTPFVSLYRALRSADSGAGYVADANYGFIGKPLGSGTFTDSGDVVTFASVHGLAVNDRVIFQGIASTTGIVNNTVYYVKTVGSTTTVTLSATQGGSTLTLTTDGLFTGATKSSDAGAGAMYDGLSALIGGQETGNFYEESRMGFIAHPSLKARLRGVKDTNGNPLWVAGLAGTPDTAFGYPIKYSLGARTSTAASSAPTGNKLVFFGNYDHLLLGIRSGPESVVIDGRSGASALTDETILKMRARRAWGVAFPQAWSVYEDAAN